MSQSQAEKESLLNLRRMIRGELNLHRSSGCWYCKECGYRIVQPEGVRGDRIEDVNGALETVPHGEGCSITKRRIELGLEDPQARKAHKKQRKIADLQEEIAAREVELASLREDLEAAKRQ